MQSIEEIKEELQQQIKKNPTAFKGTVKEFFEQSAKIIEEQQCNQQLKV